MRVGIGVMLGSQNMTPTQMASFAALRETPLSPDDRLHANEFRMFARIIAGVKRDRSQMAVSFANGVPWSAMRPPDEELCRESLDRVLEGAYGALRADMVLTRIASHLHSSAKSLILWRTRQDSNL
jgi:hypothetical protein